MTKVISLNILFFFVFLILIKTSIFFKRTKSNDDFGYLLDRNYYNSELNDSCKVMKTHPILSHVHMHSNNCEIKDGYSNGLNVYYDEKILKNDEFVVTLGGSTTDGFYQHFSNGNTYPLYLNKILKKNGSKLKVINGGTGAYGSTQELLKLLTDISILKHKIKYVISLSGNNDIYNYGQTSKENYEKSPFMSNTQFGMYLHDYWMDQRKPNFVQSLFPNIQYLFRRMGAKKQNTIKYDYLFSKNYKNLDAIDRWYNNIKLMNSISKSIDAKFMVFVQPAMGIDGSQSFFKDETSSDFKMFQNLDKRYLKNLNKSHQGYDKYCKKLIYCINISHIAPPNGKMYVDPRHHGAEGNKLIAQEISKYLLN
jgi:hypothetical protein